MVALEGDVMFRRVGLGRVVWFLCWGGLWGEPCNSVGSTLQWMTLVILLCLDCR
jgi:hypothetical protein